MKRVEKTNEEEESEESDWIEMAMKTIRDMVIIKYKIERGIRIQTKMKIKKNLHLPR